MIYDALVRSREYAMYSTLISANQLQQHLHDAGFVIIDCRFELSTAGGRNEVGRDAYRHEHVPGAIYAHLNEDLSGPITPESGRHPLPDAHTLMKKLGNWGINEHKQVIAYDTDNGAMAASRLWWLLRWLGHEKVAVLDGGFKHWQASGFATSAATFTPNATTFHGMPRASMVADSSEVQQRASNPDWKVIDARAAERFAGKVEPIDAIAGHVPGAVNHPNSQNVQADGQWKSADILRSQFANTLDNVSGTHVISMCGSGVTACHNLLALEIAGIHGAKLYAGSWSEWIRDASRPVARDV